MAHPRISIDSLFRACYISRNFSRPSGVFGEKIIRLQEIASTNEVAKEEARKGSPEGTVVVAVSQNAGRGRLARKWFSPPGGLWASVVLRPRIPPRDVPKLTAICGMAVAEALKAKFGIEAGLKWPNDVLVGGKKICGILAEAASGRDGIDFVVVGIGLNVNNDTAEFGPELAPLTTSVVAVTGNPADVEAVLKGILERFEWHYMLLQGGAVAELRKAYGRLIVTVGRKVRVTMPEGVVEGTAEAIDEDFALIVRAASGSAIRIVAGDCVHCETAR
jgi:BirA family biotin operon repressor/biotin-[acetyl-CoA-carboxylase] ligase